MIWFYRFLFPFVFLVGLPFYLRRILRRGGYRERFGDRFGAFAAPSRKEGPTIWIQAVSVGEVLAIEPVLRRLRDSLPSANLFLTTTTSTGFGLLKEKPGLADWTGYFPLDFWPISARAWRKLKPDLCVLMEGELWPEHLEQARQRSVPVILANGRLSDRSFRCYSAAGLIGRWPFRMLSSILASSTHDEERLRKMAPFVPIALSGNLKFDVDFPPRPEGAARRDDFKALGIPLTEGPLPLLLLGSSTWPGEEALLTRVLRRLVNEGIDSRLLIVPRHAERRREVVEALESCGLPIALRSRGESFSHDTPILIADTTGELRYFTSLSDIAFIGKSIPPNDGGQTPIEAAAFGVPMVYGPAMTNFKAVCRSLEECGAALRKETIEEIEDTLVSLGKDAVKRSAMSASGISWHRSNRGAVDRTVAAITEMFGGSAATSVG